MDTAERHEAAHVVRRGGRKLIQDPDTWPFIGHRSMQEVMEAEQAAGLRRDFSREVE